MANIMSKLNIRNKPSRDGYDLSKKRAYTAKVGELLPVWMREVMPGDKFSINLEWFTRTMPVNTAAFTRVREYYDFFFVPFEQLWKYFPQFYTNMPDSPVAASNINTSNLISDYHPHSDSTALYNYLKLFSSEKFNEYSRNPVGLDRRECTGKLLWYLNYGMNFYNYATTKPDGDISNLTFSYSVNLFPLLAYQKIYNDFFRNQDWEKAQPWTFNVDYMNGSSRSSMELPLDDIDLSSSTMFDLRYCNWNKDQFMGLLPNAQYGDVAAINFNMLDGKNVGSFFFNRGYLSPAFQTSDITDGDKNVNIVGSSGLGVFPNPTPLFYKTGGSVDGDVNKALRFAIEDDDYNRLFSSVNAIALRQLEALQKYKEILKSGSQDYKSVIEDLFGVNVTDTLSNQVYYLGGTSDNINISEVLNQAFPSENQTADIRGKGTGAGRGSVQFDSSRYGNRPGVIMCIYHSMPLLDYATGGVDKFNTKCNLWDYANPVFDRLGMVSVPLRELTTSNAVAEAITGLDDPVSSEADPNTMILGFAPRYIDYKTDHDDVVGAFCTTLGSWTAPISNNYIVDYLRATFTFLETYAGNQFLDYSFLKVNPAVLDSIFVAAVDSTVDSDQFLINCDFNVKAVRNLDANGLPY